MIKISSNYSSAIQHIEETYNQFAGGYPFDGIFMDDSFARLYSAEQRFGNLFTGFSVLAVIIACIGLFALTNFTLERRFKEIAIRKVMGASSIKVTGLILFEFLKLILVSALIAIPAIYFLGNEWLTSYVDRIQLGPLILIFPTVSVMIIAVLSSVFQTYKVAESNPVAALKQE